MFPILIIMIVQQLFMFVSVPIKTFQNMILLIFQINLICLPGKSVEPYSFVAALWPQVAAPTLDTLSHILG